MALFFSHHLILFSSLSSFLWIFFNFFLFHPSQWLLLLNEFSRSSFPSNKIKRLSLHPSSSLCWVDISPFFQNRKKSFVSVMIIFLLGSWSQVWGTSSSSWLWWPKIIFFAMIFSQKRKKYLPLYLSLIIFQLMRRKDDLNQSLNPFLRENSSRFKILLTLIIV